MENKLNKNDLIYKTYNKEKNVMTVISNETLTPVLRKEFLNIHATIEYGFTLKHVRDMIIIYSQMHRTNKYSQRSSIIWPVWLNG